MKQEIFDGTIYLIAIAIILGLMIVGYTCAAINGFLNIRKQLSLILKNQKTMSEALDAIKSDLVATKAIVIKVKADVEGLHAKLDALGDAPTPEQLAEVKALSADLVTSLQAVDDETADA